MPCPVYPKRSANLSGYCYLPKGTVIYTGLKVGRKLVPIGRADFCQRVRAHF